MTDISEVTGATYAIGVTVDRPFREALSISGNPGLQAVATDARDRLTAVLQALRLSPPTF